MCGVFFAPEAGLDMQQIVCAMSGHSLFSSSRQTCSKIKGLAGSLEWWDVRRALKTVHESNMLGWG